nr:hypothetical protein [Salipaludibacillus neizhouensis]
MSKRAISTRQYTIPNRRKSESHFDFATLVYNAMKLAGLRLKTERNQVKEAA